jgi:hypothetical protein
MQLKGELQWRSETFSYDCSAPGEGCATARTPAWRPSGAAAFSPPRKVRFLRVFCNLADWETAEGTPLEAVLARLPSEMAEGTRRGLGVILAATPGLSEARLDR